MKTDLHVAVIGAGAAGLAAAIFAAETRPDLNIILLDGARTIGAKILVSGGGRCNVTNTVVTPKDFHAPPRIVQRILKRFNEYDTRQWFESIGVPLMEEPTGKIFPVSNKARSVLNALLLRCDELGVRIKTQHHVKAIEKNAQRFRIRTDSGIFISNRVIMATGGKSLPKTGSDGTGWSIARQLGHSITECYCALVPLVLDTTFFHKALSGTSHQATLSTTVQGKVVDRRTGSLLWTHFGVSGPVVMDASRFWVKAHESGVDTTLSISFLPGQPFEKVEREFLHCQKHRPRTTILSFLSRQLPQRVAKALCSHVVQKFTIMSSSKKLQTDLSAQPISQLTRQQRRALIQVVIHLDLPVVNSRGWNFAEVTAGGVPLQEVNVTTMESRKTLGLYLIGEMLDCDGRIGGFNFQWAWSTGYIAGTKIAEHMNAL